MFNICTSMIRRYSSLVDQLAVSAGNFLTVAICAHSLPLEEQGKFVYIFSTYMGLLLINVSGLFQGAAVRSPGRENLYESSLISLQWASAILLSIMTGVGWYLFSPEFGWVMTLTQLLLVISFFLFQQLADFKRRAAYIFSVDIDAVISSFSLYGIRVIALLILRPENLNSVLLILVLSSVIPVIQMALSLVKIDLSLRVRCQLISEHLHFSRFFVFGSLLSWFWTQVPVFMLGLMQGKESAAILVSIRGISNVANILMEQLETKVVADWARMYHSKGAESLKQAIKKLNLISFIFWLAVMAVILLFGEQIIALVLGNLYAPYSLVLIISWIAYGAFYVSRVYGIQHRTLGDNRIESVGGVFGLAVALIASWLIIPLFNVAGAAGVYILIAISMLLSQVLFPKKLVNHL